MSAGIGPIFARSWAICCLQVLFYAQMASEPGYFTIADVIAGLNRKLVRRHPHVFGDEASVAAGQCGDLAARNRGYRSGQVLRNWDAIKRAEKQGSSALDSIPRGLPSLMEAAKLGSRAQKSGFDWPDLEGIFAKLEEETEELRQAIDEHLSFRHARGGNRFRSGRSALHHGQPGPASAGGAGIRPAPHQRQISPPFRRHGIRFRRSLSRAMSAAQLESLWSQAKLAESPSPSR